MPAHSTHTSEDVELPSLHSISFSWLDSSKRLAMPFHKRTRSSSLVTSNELEELSPPSVGYNHEALGHCRSPSTTSSCAESLTYSASSIASTPSTPGTFPGSPLSFLCEQETGPYKEVDFPQPLDSVYPDVVPHHRRAFSPQIHVIMEESDGCEENSRPASPHPDAFQTLSLPIRVRRSRKRGIRPRGGSDPSHLSTSPTSSAPITLAQFREMRAETPARVHSRTKSLPALPNSRSLILCPRPSSHSDRQEAAEKSTRRHPGGPRSPSHEETFSGRESCVRPRYECLRESTVSPPPDGNIHDIALVERICQSILREVYGVDSSNAVVPLKVLDAVIRCLEDIDVVAQHHGWTSNGGTQASPGDNSSWGNSSTTCTRSSEQRGSGGSNSRKRTSQQAGDDSDDFANDHPDGDDLPSPDDMSRKRAKTAAQQPAFSCPYRKRNPLRFNIRDYENCCRKPIIGIAEVKRHIQTWHRRGAPVMHQCRRCKKGFPSEEALDRHSELPKDQMCEPEGRDKPTQDPEDGITDEMSKTLVDRKANGKIQTWEQICRLIFPTDPDVPQPAFEPVIEHHEVKDELKKATGLLCDGLQRELSNVHELDPGRRFQILRALETVVDVYVAFALRSCKGRLGSSPLSVTRRPQNTSIRRSSATKPPSLELAAQTGSNSRIKPAPGAPIPLRRLAPQRNRLSSQTQIQPSPSLPPMSESGDTSSLADAQPESYVPSPEAGFRDSGISLHCDADHNCTADAGGCLCQLDTSAGIKAHDDFANIYRSYYPPDFSQQAYPGWEFWPLQNTDFGAGFPSQVTASGPQLGEYNTFDREGQS